MKANVLNEPRLPGLPNIKQVSGNVLGIKGMSRLFVRLVSKGRE